MKKLMKKLIIINLIIKFKNHWLNELIDEDTIRIFEYT